MQSIRARRYGPRVIDTMISLKASKEFSPAEESRQRLDHIAELFLSMLEKADGKAITFKDLCDAIERQVLVKTLVACGGHQTKAAHFLRLLPTTLSAKIKKHKIVIEHAWTAEPDDETIPAEPGETHVGEDRHRDLDVDS